MRYRVVEYKTNNTYTFSQIVQYNIDCTKFVRTNPNNNNEWLLTLHVYAVEFNKFMKEISRNNSNMKYFFKVKCQMDKPWHLLVDSIQFIESEFINHNRKFNAWIHENLLLDMDLDNLIKFFNLCLTKSAFNIYLKRAGKI